MTDDLTLDELIAEEARATTLRHEPQPDTADLPDDVRDGDIEIATEDDPTEEPNAIEREA